MSTQAKKVLERGTWNICELLVSSAPPCEVEGVGPESQPIVVGMHHFGCQAASPNIEFVDSFM